MTLTIKHPEPGFTGSHSGLDFTDGVAEFHALDDDARGPLLDNGFTIDGENSESEAEIAAREAAEAEEAAKAEAKRKADEEAEAAAKVKAEAEEAARVAAEKAEADKAAKVTPAKAEAKK